jgi:hypothetical protein
MPNSPIVPWLLPDDDAPEIIERIEVEGKAIKIPVYGSVSVDEARYLEHYNATHGLGNTSLMPMAEAVYSLLLLRFGGAAWTGKELVAIKGKLPTFEETMTYGDPRRMLPAELISQVYMFFVDEFSANLGKPRTALDAEREAQRASRSQSLPTGAGSTGDASNTIQTTPDLQGQLLVDAPSTSSQKRSRSTKTSDSSESTMTAAA